METDVTMPDDPPEKDESSKEAEEDAEPLKDHRDLLTKELSEQLPDGQFINQSGQDDAAVEEASTDNLQTARKASKKSPCKMQQGAVFSGKILSFCCSECKGDTTYSPNDLLKHFQGSHKGTLPTYPCDLCSFVTNEFASLQRHRIGHRNPQVTCEICNDGVQYSLLLLTRHYIMCHSQNGHFHCEKCEFSTKDAGTFVQHIHHHNEGRHKCVKCQYVSPSRRELQRHVLVHSATFPFTCHFCGYGAARKDYLTKHMATAHCEENDRKSRWRMIEEKPCVTSPPGLKLLLKKGPVAGGSREPQWMSKRECPMCRARGPYVPLWLGCEPGFYLDAAPPTHAFAPCGHVCSEKTVAFWSQIPLPHGTHTFHAACPFCAQQLCGEQGYIRLIFQGPVD